MNEKTLFFKDRPVMIGLITAAITAFVTTSFNDYLSFREADAVHELRLQQIKQNLEIFGADLRREMGQIRVLISTNDTMYISRIIALTDHKDDMIARLARLEATLSNLKSQDCSSWNPTTKTILAAD